MDWTRDNLEDVAKSVVGITVVIVGGLILAMPIVGMALYLMEIFGG